MQNDESRVSSTAVCQEFGRLINERIKKRLSRNDNTMSILCECANYDCEDVIEVTRDQYERIRQNDARFLVCDGHEMGRIESIVGREGSALVVEKNGRARRLVEARSSLTGSSENAFP